jgi:hypothetical protein
MLRVSRKLRKADGLEPTLNASTGFAAVNSRERFGHLTAIGILDADK